MILTQIFRSTLVVSSAAAAVAALVGSPTANADYVPAPLHFSIDVSSASSFSYFDEYEAAVDSEIGGGMFAYTILSVNNSTFQFNPTSLTIAKGSPNDLPAGMFTGLAFHNKSGEHLQVVITLLLETAFSPTAGIVPWETNVSIGLSGNTTISTLPGSPFWQVGVDGLPIGNIFADPSVLSGGPGGTTTDQSLDGLALAPTSYMTIQIAFDITPSGQVSFNGNFTMIPAPGALALLALGGIIGPRRRRRTSAF